MDWGAARRTRNAALISFTVCAGSAPPAAAAVSAEAAAACVQPDAEICFQLCRILWQLKIKVKDQKR